MYRLLQSCSDHQNKMYPKCTMQDTHDKDVAILKGGWVSLSRLLSPLALLGLCRMYHSQFSFSFVTVMSSCLRIPLAVFEQAFRKSLHTDRVSKLSQVLLDIPDSCKCYGNSAVPSHCIDC